MAFPPPPYSNIAGITRADMKYNEQESITSYDGNARPGELVVDLVTVPPTLYIGDDNGVLNPVGGGSGNGVPAAPTNSIQFNAGGGSFGGSANLVFATGTLSAGVNILPQANNVYSLGSPTLQWASVYVAGNTIYLDNIPISVANASTLLYNGLPLVSQDIAGNINIPGVVVANGITYPNGTPITSSYGNANVAAYLPTNSATVTGAQIGNAATYLYGDGSNITGIAGNYNDANVEALLESGTLANNIITTGNITGSEVIATYLHGDGSNITGVISSYGNANVELLLETGIANNITTTGIVTGSNINAGTNNLFMTGNTIATAAQTIVVDPLNDGTPAGNVVILGNLQVAGNLIAVTAITSIIDNLTWQSANAASTQLLAAGGGITVGPYATPYATWLYNPTSNAWQSNIGGTFLANVTGPNVVASYLWGDGSNISNIAAGNVITFGTSNVRIESSNGNILGTIAGGNALAIKSAGQVALGVSAGNVSQSSGAIAIGSYAGNTSQSGGGIAIGQQAAYTGQATFGIAVGTTAGNINQSSNAIAVGYAAGSNTQGTYSTAIGALSGQTAQGAYGVAVGFNSGASTQGTYGVAVGYQAGSGSQGLSGIAIGYNAGGSTQGANSIAIGRLAGISLQGTNSIAIGTGAAQAIQKDSSIAIGNNAAGLGAQAYSAVAIGQNAGYNFQGNSAVAIGQYTANSGQGINSVAIGSYAGYLSQGANSVAIGYNAGANTQPANSIAINATGTTLNPTNSGFFVNPVRNDTGNTANVVYFNAATNELTYAPAAGGSSYGNANVSTYLASGTANANIITTANVNASFFNGNGRFLTGITANTIQNGLSIVNFSGANGNILMSISGTSVGNIGPTNTSLGAFAGGTSSGQYATAVGYGAGSGGQSTRTVAVGYGAGGTNQSTGAVAIGNTAGATAQGANSVAIGTNAGYATQGANSIAIGTNAGTSSQPANSIILNATGTILNGTNSGLYINPIRLDNANSNIELNYNTTTNEITYSQIGPSFQATATLNANLTYTTATGTTVITATKDWDTGNCFNNTGANVTLNGLTVPAYSFAPNRAGYYYVHGYLSYASMPASSGIAFMVINKNGSPYKRGMRLPCNTVGIGLEVNDLVYLNGAGDYVTLINFQNCGSTANAETNGTDFAPTFSAAWIRNA